MAFIAAICIAEVVAIRSYSNQGSRSLSWTGLEE